MHLKKCGTYKFCKGCKVGYNCCTANLIDLPVMLKKDVDIISESLMIKPEAFSKKVSVNLYQMKHSNEGCYFYKNGKCTIYDQRPIDCRLFPFDLKLSKNKKLQIVLYTSVCELPLNMEFEYLDVVKLVKMLEPHQIEFAKYNTPLLQNHTYIHVSTIKSVKCQKGQSSWFRHPALDAGASAQVALRSTGK